MKIFTAEEARKKTEEGKEKIFMLDLIVLAIQKAAGNGETSLNYTVECRKKSDRKNAILVKQILVQNGYHVKTEPKIDKNEKKIKCIYFVIDWSKE